MLYSGVRFILIDAAVEGKEALVRVLHDVVAVDVEDQLNNGFHAHRL
jgi:hypothetical protein